MSSPLRISQALGLVGAFYGADSPETISCSLVNKTALQWVNRTVTGYKTDSPNRRLARKGFQEIEWELREKRVKWFQKHASLINLDRRSLLPLFNDMIDQEIGKNGQTDWFVHFFGFWWKSEWELNRVEKNYEDFKDEIQEVLLPLIMRKTDDNGLEGVNVLRSLDELLHDPNFLKIQEGVSTRFDIHEGRLDRKVEVLRESINWYAIKSIAMVALIVGTCVTATFANRQYD